jgi:hypothetical protein
VADMRSIGLIHPDADFWHHICDRRVWLAPITLSLYYLTSYIMTFLPSSCDQSNFLLNNSSIW